MKQAAQNEGPIETQILSTDSDPLGMGSFEVKVTTLGIELRPLGESDWKTFSFSELMILDMNLVIKDCDWLLGQYEHDVRDKLGILQQKLEDVRRALAEELRPKARRKKFVSL